MADTPKNEEKIDRKLDELLDAMRRTPQRDPRTVESAKARYLVELGTLDLPENPTLGSRLVGWLRTVSEPKEKQRMSSRRLVTSSVLGLSLVLVLLFGGAGATAYAAQNALPGDVLFPVKTGLEETRIRLSADAATQAELHLALAEKRLDEISRLVEDKRYDDIALATDEFELQIRQAIGAFQTAAGPDPKRAAALATRIAHALSRYATTLSSTLGQVPDAVKPQVERALSLSQSGSGMSQGGEIEFSGTIESLSPGVWVVDGQPITITQETEIEGQFAVGDFVKIHAVGSPDGSLVAVEIATGMVGDSEANDNGNTNDDVNDNDNVNANANDDDDDNANDDDDDNANDDDDDNANDDDDDNANDDDDDNANDDDDDNANDDDDVNDNVGDNDDDTNENDNATDD